MAEAFVILLIYALLSFVGSVCILFCLEIGWRVQKLYRRWKARRLIGRMSEDLFWRGR